MNEGAARVFANWKVKDTERRIERKQKKKISINSRAVEKEQLHRGFHNTLFETYGVLGKQEDSLQQKLSNQSQKRQAEACRAQETSLREHEDTRRFQFHNRNQNCHTTRISLGPVGDIQSIPESRASGDKPRDRNSRRKATPRTYLRHVTPSIQVDPEARVYLGSRGVEVSYSAHQNCSLLTNLRILMTSMIFLWAFTRKRPPVLQTNIKLRGVAISPADLPTTSVLASL